MYFGALTTSLLSADMFGSCGGVAGAVVGALTIGVWTYLECYKKTDDVTRYLLDVPPRPALDEAYNYSAFGIPRRI